MSEMRKNNCQNPYNICYDNYLNTNACTECTGLICTPAKDNDEWENYREIFDFIPETAEIIQQSTPKVPNSYKQVQHPRQENVQTNDSSEVLSVL